jgi:vibriolysin
MKAFYGALLFTTFAIAGCSSTVDGTSKATQDDPPNDVQQALNALPNATVLSWTNDHLPTYIVGELAKLDAMQSDDAATDEAILRPALGPIVAPMRLVPGNLVLRQMNTDDQGARHFRYIQTFNSVPVVGGDLVVHVDVKGAISGVNGRARGDISPSLGSGGVSQSAAMATINGDSRFAGMAASSVRTVYIQTDDGKLHKAYEATVQGKRGADPALDKVYVDMDSGEIIADYPQIYYAESRNVYSAGNSTNLPGTVERSEGQAATSDTDVNSAYDGTGNTWAAYHEHFNRDSYDNKGATLISSVHYDQNFCNAYWDGTQMVYGDGDPSQGCGPLARAQDVTAHELTHAVTQYTSALNYSGESGGMNESMSDSHGEFVEAWVAGGKTGPLDVTANTWLVGEQVFTTPLRYMCDPAKDGSSADYYTSSVGGLDPHYSSGIGNLELCLSSIGGTHPRGKSDIQVPAIGLDKAIRIRYKANTDILTSTSSYADWRTAEIQAATDLGYDQATQDAVGCAWAAVGVGTAPSSCGGGTGSNGSNGSDGSDGSDGGDGTLTNNVPISNVSGATASNEYWSMTVPTGQSTLTFTISGGTGDADLYVQAGSKPTLTTYTCRPYITGNTETCTITNPAAGTWWVMLNGYAAYSGVTLKGVYTSSGGGTTGDPYLTSGVGVTGVSGAASSAQYWRINTPAGKTLTVSISGGSGDADLYTRFASRPTTNYYSCRPYLTGNSESCTTSSTKSGDYYVMIRGYQSFSGVSLVASY